MMVKNLWLGILEASTILIHMKLRVRIVGVTIPPYNSQEMEKYCAKILEVLEKNDNLISIIQALISLLDSNAEKLDLSDRKLFERNETTDFLLSVV